MTCRRITSENALASSCVPLCLDHHTEGHQQGWRTFEVRHGLDLAAIAAKLWAESNQLRRAALCGQRPGDCATVSTAVAQIHIVNGVQIQTLAAVESPDGLILLSTFGGADGLRDIALHIPAAARSWLAEIAGRAPPEAA
jgi:hypothetical protein